jgi:rhodanese-related sulfurtransferase
LAFRVSFFETAGWHRDGLTIRAARRAIYSRQLRHSQMNLSGDGINRAPIRSHPKSRMTVRNLRLLSFGTLGLIVCAALWLGAEWAFGGPLGGKVTWESVFAWIQRDWPGVPQMTTAELARRLGTEKERPVLIDTRAREEYAVSHLPGAVWAETTTQIRAALSDVPGERAVVLYCSVGVRSSKAAAALLKGGRGNLSNLRGSIFQWANEGRAIERDGKPVTAVHPFNRKWGELLDPKLRAEAAR